MRATGYPEYPALLVAAQLTGRPVRWLSSRSEGFLTDNQARDTIIDAALALEKADVSWRSTSTCWPIWGPI